MCRILPIISTRGPQLIPHHPQLLLLPRHLYLLMRVTPTFNVLSSRVKQRLAMSSLQDYELRQRRFAPLNPANCEPTKAPQLKGIVFDVDGTLCLPQNYMFGEMRAALGISKSVDILHHVRSLPTAEEQLEASNKIKAIEREAMQHQEPQPGLVELMEYLRDKGIKRALCTRNFEMPVMNLLQNHLPEHIFLPIITRETPGLLPKPDPAGILHIATEWGLDNGGEDLIMVGDSVDDITAGHTAGAATVLLLNDHNGHLREHMHTDLVIENLHELIDILENGFVGHRTRAEQSSLPLTGKPKLVGS